jgi:hypothetical protein
VDGETSPEDLLLSVYDNFPGEFAEYWGLNAEFAPEDLDPLEWEELKELHRLALRLQPIAEVLARPRRLPEKQLRRPRELLEAHSRSQTLVREILEQVRAEQGTDSDLFKALIGLTTIESQRYLFFQTCLQIHVAPTFMVWPGQVADNLVRLTRYVPRVTTGRAIQYLSRVSLCYLRDMPAELAVMARAVLGALLESTIDLDTLRAERRMPKRARVGLQLLIDEALKREWLSPAGHRAAQKVKEHGDDAAHFSPQLLGDCDQVMEPLVAVLAELEKHDVN